jgi:hypothetical protein
MFLEIIKHFLMAILANCSYQMSSLNHIRALSSFASPIARNKQLKAGKVPPYIN